MSWRHMKCDIPDNSHHEFMEKQSSFAMTHRSNRDVDEVEAKQEAGHKGAPVTNTT